MTKNDAVLKEYYKIILLFVVQMMFLTTFVINDFMKTHIYSPTKIQIVTELILGFIAFALSISSIFVVKKLYKTAQQQYFNKVNELKYANIEEQSKLQQKHRHDILNHLHVLSILSQEKRYDELDSYLLHYRAEIESVILSVNTGLQEMDVLLYSKLNAAHKKNIAIKFKCTATIQCKKRYIINLISILGNLLENAIEASAESEDRTLSVIIKEDPIDYSFIIRNSCGHLDDALQQKLFQEGVTTKGDGRGMGLEIVKMLTDNFEGKIILEYKDSIFEVRLDLPKHRLQN